MPCTQYLKNQKFRRANRLNWLKDLETIPINFTEAHVQTPRYRQYLTHAHNNITPAVAAMDSCFALFGTHGLCTCVRYWPYRPRSWYVCFNAVNWYCFKFIWAHRSIFLIPSPYACRGRTVLQFPTNSYRTCLRWSCCLKHCLHSPHQ